MSTEIPFDLSSEISTEGRYWIKLIEERSLQYKSLLCLILGPLRYITIDHFILSFSTQLNFSYLLNNFQYRGVGDTNLTKTYFRWKVSDIFILFILRMFIFIITNQNLTFVWSLYRMSYISFWRFLKAAQQPGGRFSPKIILNLLNVRFYLERNYYSYLLCSTGITIVFLFFVSMINFVLFCHID